MKKNNEGFIAMSLVYSFFIVFVVVLISILAFYIDDNAIMEKLNKQTISRYNEGLGGKDFTFLYSKSILKRGDFVAYNTNSADYNKNGLWHILKSDGTNVYIISNFVVSYIQASSFTQAYVQATYESSLVNPNLAESIEILTASDLWPSSRSSLIRNTNAEYPMWNVGAQFFVQDGGVIKIVAPNCSCTGTVSGSPRTSYYANDVPVYPTLVSWFTNANSCAGFTISNYLSSALNNCPIRFIANTTSYPLASSYVSGYRAVIKLKNNAFLVGGTGSISNPYRVGVIN